MDNVTKTLRKHKRQTDRHRDGHDGHHLDDDDMLETYKIKYSDQHHMSHVMKDKSLVLVNI